jgi:cellobiose-specific phosphotransferase system component IIA
MRKVAVIPLENYEEAMDKLYKALKELYRGTVKSTNTPVRNAEKLIQEAHDMLMYDEL